MECQVLFYGRGASPYPILSKILRKGVDAQIVIPLRQWR